MTERIAIYGGTFNPPHLAHVSACKAFCNALRPNKLLIIPDFLPPHKEISGNVTSEDRLEMTRLAFDVIPEAVVSDMEMKRGGRSYTAITLGELKTEHNELYFLCGTDMFLSLESWYRPDIIFSLATICYVRRENDKENDIRLLNAEALYKEKYNAKIIAIKADVIELSSSEIRAKIENNRDVCNLLPENVNSYIQKRGIYK